MRTKYLKYVSSFFYLHEDLLKIIFFNFAWFSFFLGQPIFLDIFFLFLFFQKVYHFKLIQTFLILLNDERLSFKNVLLMTSIEESVFLLNFLFFCSILISIILQFLNPIKLYLELFCAVGFLSYLFKFILLVFLQIKTRKSLIAFLLVFFRFEQYVLLNLLIIYYTFWFNLFNGRFDFIIIYLDKIFYSL